MIAYFIRRLLLVPVTFVGITLLVYCVLRLTPGNPVETELQQMQQVSNSGGGRGAAGGEVRVPPEVLMELLERYRMEKGVIEGYLGWLGLWPQEQLRSSATFLEGSATTEVMVTGTGRKVSIAREGDRLAAERPHFADGTPLGPEWKVRLQTPAQISTIWQQALGLDTPPQPPPPYRVVLFQPRLSGLLQGNLSRSSKYELPVWSMMRERIPVSLLFGLGSLILIYGICIPLGISKALRHGGWYDSITSALVFAGFAIPGYALGALLLVWLGGQLHWFPLAGLTSPGFQTMSWGEKVLDVIHHAVLPLLCYVISSFAMMTLLVKNSLMDQLGSDYIRTAVAKGVTYRQAVVRHALRNALIPVATHFGAILSVFVSGSLLIETVFNINGFGLLSFQAVMDRDYFVTMGTLALSSLLVLLGNILSDLAVAVVDPRVSYD